MKTTDEVKSEILVIAKQFTDGLNGRFKEFVSDKFIQVYLAGEFTSEFARYRSKNVEPNAINLAYQTSVTLFESYLEYGCRAGGNGHHVAQNYSAHFQSFSFSSDPNI